jgi:predicted nucleic acid-binding protein
MATTNSRDWIFTHAFSESSFKSYEKNGLARRDTKDRADASSLSQDANDDMVLEVAINGGADAIVTNNTKHFRDVARRFQLQVLSPAELLNEFRMRR